MRMAELAEASRSLAATSARLAKVEILAGLLRSAAPAEAPIAVHYLAGSLPQGSIGVGWASLRDLAGPAAAPSLDVIEVDATISRIASATGPGSQAARRAELDGLFGRATEPERRFLVGLLTGELRQGALEGVMVEAVARAAGVPARAVRRSSMLAGSLAPVAAAALADGAAGLARFHLTVLRPIGPMLAQTAADLGEALGRIRPAAVEWKLDGARIQVHRLGEEVRIFTRSLADATDRLPDVVEAVRLLPAWALILDGEAIGLGGGGRPRPFQVTMSRFGSRIDVDALRKGIPLSAFFFDCLHAEGEDLIDRPASERFEVLAGVVPGALRAPRIVTDRDEEAAAFLQEALDRGHEGVMVKALDAPYEAGRRGAGWLKVKRAHTLDLVVLGAEWGHGRRRGRLSNLHLGARDPASGGFVMLGKTFKGMTDEMLAWQTERLLDLEERREGITVFVRPELVVEVAFDGLLPSPRYPGGLALRFARVKGYRPDKTPQDADTIETVRAIHRGALLTVAPEEPVVPSPDA